MRNACSFLAVDGEDQIVVDWLEQVPIEKAISIRADRRLYYFRELARSPLSEHEVDAEKTPLAWLIQSQKKREVLWTMGEVIFTPSPLKSQFPQLHKVYIDLQKWMKQFEIVFDASNPTGCNFNYYLEGSIQNLAKIVYALPEAAAALRKEQYFIHYDMNEPSLDTLARQLRLRGVLV